MVFQAFTKRVRNQVLLSSYKAWGICGSLSLGLRCCQLSKKQAKSRNRNLDKADRESVNTDLLGPTPDSNLVDLPSN
jgi:hypothetical protein